ncbi:MAG TPA: FAD-dependent oxidoreductase [Bacillota bacterium]|nr:FAD-dependent oxidoreductase [Bacillota bacterium]
MHLRQQSCHGSLQSDRHLHAMGQVAGTAAHLAIERGITPQEVPYPQLRERLAAQKVELAGKENPAEAP